jgi:hypothetical protein
MPTLIERLSSRLLTTDYDGWHRPRVARRLVVILVPLLVLGGFGIGLVAQHSPTLGEIPPTLFGLATIIVGLTSLAVIDSVSHR